MLNKKRTAVAWLFFVALVLLSTAGFARTLSDIQIEGLGAIPQERVYERLPFEFGSDVSDEAVSKSIAVLFETGFFDNIQANWEGDVLRYYFQERPTITAVSFEGNKLIKDEQIEDTLERVGLVKGEIYQVAVLEQLQSELELVYSSTGRYDTYLYYEVEPQGANGVTINLFIQESVSFKVMRINFVGNDYFSDRFLNDQLQTETTGPWSFLNKKNTYIQERFQGDLQRIEALYRDAGFLLYELEDVHVSADADEAALYLNVTVDEGVQFFVKDTIINGDFILPKAEVETLMALEVGSTFSQAEIDARVKAVENRLGDIGYIFADVRVDYALDAENQEVIVYFQIEPKEKIYINRIYIDDNTVTSDEVIRREIRQKEKALASHALIALSEARINRLGYFSAVNFQTVPVPGSDNLADIYISVTEQLRSSVGVELQYSTLTKTNIGGFYNHINAFGSGYDITSKLTLNRLQQQLSFSVRNPYFTKDGVSLEYQLFYNKNSLEDSDISGYSMDSFGGRLNWGYPLSENSYINYGIEGTLSNLRHGDDASLEVKTYAEKSGDYYKDWMAYLSYGYSTLDRGFLPTAGTRINLSGRFSFLRSTTDYYEISYSSDSYYPFGRLLDGFIWHAKTSLFYGSAYGDSPYYPFYRHHYMGGISSVRTYYASSLGPRATTKDGALGSSFGGNISANVREELIFPELESLPSMRAGLFLDGGMVWNDECIVINETCNSQVDIGDMRYSAGAYATWYTAFAPISFSYGKALNADESQREERFQFAIGYAF